MSLTAGLVAGSSQVHAIDTKGQWSNDARRDEKVIFGVGKRLALENGISNYSGVILSAGRRFTQSFPDIAAFHCIAWKDPHFMRLLTIPGKSGIDWINQGIIDVADLHLLRAIIILESENEIIPLNDMLERSDRAEEHADDSVGRVREAPPQEEETEADVGPSISERESVVASEIELFYSEVLGKCYQSTVLRRAIREQVFLAEEVSPSLGKLLREHAQTSVSQRCTSEHAANMSLSSDAPMHCDNDSYPSIKPYECFWHLSEIDDYRVADAADISGAIMMYL